MIAPVLFFWLLRCRWEKNNEETRFDHCACELKYAKSYVDTEFHCLMICFQVRKLLFNQNSSSYNEEKIFSGKQETNDTFSTLQQQQQQHNNLYQQQWKTRNAM